MNHFLQQIEAALLPTANQYAPKEFMYKSPPNFTKPATLLPLRDTLLPKLLSGELRVT